MAIYIYRRAASNGARDLAEQLDAIRYQARRVPMHERVQPGDIVICWGESMPAVPGVRILNGTALQDKYDDAVQLASAGVPTIAVSRTRPDPPPPVPLDDPAERHWVDAQDAASIFLDMAFGRNTEVIRRCSDLTIAMQTLLRTIGEPVPTAAPSETWVGRLRHHVSGNDLLNPPETPDFWVRKEDLVEEVRVHSFMGRSIRAGRKVPREDMPDPERHPWVRSMDAGWRMSYSGSGISQAQRDLAHAACRALNLDFGAVDIGMKADGTLIVLEVNRAPGISDGTADKYAQAIQTWMANPAE
jgi:hypothetical protein